MEQEMLYIQTINKLGSFSQAARALYLTQPALSQAVQRVEAKIGMPVFDRTRKPLQLTEAGKLYIEKATQIERLEAELDLQLRELQDGESGEIRIGTTHYFASRILPPVIRKYISAYPMVRIDLVETSAQKCKQLLLEQQIDITFVSSRSEDTDYLRFPAFQDYILLAVPAPYKINSTMEVSQLTGLDVIRRRHLDPLYPTVDLAAFADIPWVLLTDKLDLRKRAEIFFRTAGVEPNIRLGVEQFITAYHMARAGIGATFIYDRSIQDAGRDLCYYKIPYPESVRNLDMVLNKKRYISRATRLFIEMLQEYYHE